MNWRTVTIKRVTIGGGKGDRTMTPKEEREFDAEVARVERAMDSVSDAMDSIGKWANRLTND